ncbi:hypothetical protein RND71_038289 [Anisodus tanguticus]|uniref:Aminotransferase-like plant mobile domain-containing protein n=1 Tax=Anisodus tanguticus TaxID=243964 RepID=A0AAE1US01_9SOLA|nr:hypothetical protein RND71_038289 [Anisodus tanguticus]
MKNTTELRCFENNWVSLDYLYERYGCRDGYKLFKNELSCTLDHWHARRPIAFTVALLGTLIFPLEHGKISACICSVAQALFEGVDGAQLTLAPMILAEIFRALGKCKRGETNVFEGCNLILQMWAMEHFYQRPNMVDICFSESNKIVIFYDRTKRARQLLDKWNDIDKMDIGDSQAGGTPEYNAWLREDHGNIDPSPEGERGFEDIGTKIWVRNLWLMDTVVTPEMWHQMQNIMQYLEDAEAGPNSVRASSSSL